MIDRETVQDMFDNMQANGIDTDDQLLWGYFFHGFDLRQLRAASADLERQGYRPVRILRPIPEDAEAPPYMLHVEKIEMHTVDSLDQRNRELLAVARKYELDAYDGMDVGRPDGRPFGEE